MKLFVTGAAGFIGSNYARLVLGTTDDQVTVFDALTYAGNRENLADLAEDPRFRFVHGDICDRDAVAGGHGRPRRRRPLRGREPRRPLHREPGRLRPHQLLGHQRAVPGGPAGRGEPVPPHLDRRGLRLHRGGLVHRGRRARAPLPVLRLQGRERPHRPQPPHHPRPAGDRHAVLQQLRALPVPGEGHPALRHQPVRRPHGAALRRRREHPRLVLRGRQLRGGRPGAAHRRGRARSTTSAPGTRSPTGS